MNSAVFLSYSRQDKERAQQIAKSLKAEGISICWDHDIPLGRDYQVVVEEMLTAASCVIVLWSSNSIKSQWVRTEATAGLEREILLPVMIEPVKIPLAFKLVQTEDFTNWRGDTQSEPWRRLVLQVRAMTCGVTAEQASIDRQPPEHIDALMQPEEPVKHPRPFGALLLTSVIILLTLVWIWGPRSFSAFFATTIGVAAVVLFLFKMAEADISPRMRALATQWLLPRIGDVRVNTAEALNQLFEAVFGREHFSAFCFVRATIASTAFLGLLLFLARFVLGATVQFTLGTWISLILYGGSVNILGDYFSLYVTRLMLRLYKKGMSIGLVVVLDFAVTATIFIFTIGVGIFLIYAPSVLNNDVSMLRGDTFGNAVLRDLMRVIHQPYLDLYDPSSPDLLPVGQRRLIYASAITTFMTSIWLWVALLLSPIVRLLVWVSGVGVTTVGFIFDVHRTPFAALGYLCALIVLLAGCSVWGTTEVLAALTH